MIIFFLFFVAHSSPSYIISGSHLDIKGNGTVTSDDVRTKSQYSEMITCTIHEGITELGGTSFMGCSKLSSITLPDSLLSISYGSFWGTGIVNLTIPKGLKYFDAGNTLYLVNFEVFFVHPDNKHFCAYDKCLYTYNHSVLVSVPNKKTSILFYEGVEEIGRFCFWDSNIKTIYIPGTVKRIGYQSFVSSKSKNIIFGQNSLLEELSEYSFQGASITSICLPPKLKTITSEAFSESKIINVTFISNSTLERLDSKSFNSCTSLELVYLPKSITYIDPQAFFGCSRLKKITVEEGCENYATNEANILFSSGFIELVFAPPDITKISIPEATAGISIGALQKLTKVPLSSVNLSDKNPNLDYKDGIIYTKEYKEAISAIGTITEALIHPNATKLRVSLFEGIAGLRSLRFGEGSVCTTIEESVCKDCVGLKSAELPSSITNLESKAFRNTGIKSITIPRNITELKKECFCDSLSLSSVIFENNSKIIRIYEYCFHNTNISSIELPDNLEYIQICCFRHSKLTSISFPDKTKYINQLILAFSDVEKVIFSELSTIEKMLTGLFQNCEKLKHVIIPSSVKTIQSSCFKDCLKLQTIEFIGTSKIESLPSLVFEGCSSLTKFELPASVQSVDASSFFGCFSLTTIIPNKGSKYVFQQNGLYFDDMKTLALFVPGVNNGSILASATKIGSNAFYGENNLLSLIFPDGSLLESIGADTFYGCSGLSKLVLPSLLKTIHNGCFRDCTNLTDWRIRDNSLLDGIGDQAFVGCSSLSIVDFGENSQLRHIGEKSFFKCQKLRSISVPSKVATIGSSAFEGCSELTEVTFEMKSNFELLTIPANCFS